MKTHIVDYSDPQQAFELEANYYDLFSEELRCVPHENTPPMDLVESGKYTAFMCKEGDEVLGILVTGRDGRILYPVLKRDYTNVLESLCGAAYNHHGFVFADTDNELILETAENFPSGSVTRTGTHLEWK